MKKGRNENLISYLQVNQKAKKKAIKWTIGVVIFSILMIIIPLVIEPSKYDVLLILFIPFVGIYVGAYLMFFRIFQDEMVEKINISLVEKCLSNEQETEVIPIEASDYKKFILGLVNIAKFYARLNKENGYVEVCVKILDEPGTRFFENIRKGCFFKYYSIVDDDVQEDKKDSDSIVKWE